MAPVVLTGNQSTSCDDMSNSVMELMEKSSGICGYFFDVIVFVLFDSLLRLKVCFQVFPIFLI